MKNLLLCGGLVLTVLLAMSFFVNVYAVTFQGWQIEDVGGQYSENNGVIRLSGTDGKYVMLYEQIAPETDFSFSLQVNAATWAGFAIMLRSSLPFAGSTQGINFQFGSPNNGSFCLARYVNGWTWNYFTTGNQENVWYTMKLSVQANPFKITAQAYDQNGVLLGSFSASDMNNLNFGNIKYLGFGALESGGDYFVRNVSAQNIPAPSLSQSSPSPTPSTGLSAQHLIESLSPSSIKVTISLRFENDNSPVEDAIVRINNVAAEHVGEGLYTVVLNTLAPYLTLNTSVERNGATQQTMDVTIWAQGNSILWTLLIIIPFLIAVLWFVLQRKKWKNGKLKLRELMKQRGRIELREASIATKLKMGKMKKLFSDLMKEDTTFKGFFVNNDKEFVFQSVLVDTVIAMGKLSFEEFSVKVGVTTIEAKEIVATLLKEKAISGAFTLDGKCFVTEDRLMDEIGKV